MAELGRTQVQAEENRRRTLREREAELDARASLIDTNTDVGFVDTLAIIWRIQKFQRYFWRRFWSKFCLMYVSLTISLTVPPWPVKIVIDHVVLGRPIEEAKGYPIFMRPLIDFMQGFNALEIMITLLALALVMVVLVGSFGPGATMDTTESNMESGHDTATQTDNWVHGGHSFVGGLWGYFEFKLNMRLTQSVNHFVRTNLFERIRQLPMTTLEDERIGDAVYRVMYDSPSVTYVFYECIYRPLMSTNVFVMAMLTMMSAYPDSPEVALFTFLVFPAYLLVTIPFSRMMRRRSQASRAAGTIVTSTIEEGMDNVLAVQSLGGNRKEKERFGKDSNEAFKRYRGIVWMQILVAQLTGLAHTAIITVVFLFVSSKIIDGVMTPGDYGALFYYYFWMRGPANDLARLWIDMQTHIAGLRRVFSLMDQPVEADMGHVELEGIEQGVSFRDVGLVYPDGRRALTGVSFDARVGEIVALVGPTGAGKTSLAYLIPRYRVATEGQVLIDGIDVTELTKDSLRKQLTYVFQETKLFSDSILDNIRFGKPEATQAEVEHVAQVAGIHDFICTLPEGYQTRLGTTSSKLSVGQKQRIAIARGLLRESRIIVLDEPTSALDPETEEYLVQSLHEAAKNRLVIIIAHRLSTIANADKIVFLDEGEVREQGSHDELMGIDDGHYRRFVELQTRESALA